MVSSTGNFDQLLAYQLKIGRILVDGDIEVTAWGEKVRGYIKRRQVGKNADGHAIYHYYDPWTKYSRHGAETKSEFDHAGYQIFREQLLEVLGIDAIHPSIADPLLRGKRNELARAKQAAQHHPSQAQAVTEITAQLEPAK